MDATNLINKSYILGFNLSNYFNEITNKALRGSGDVVYLDKSELSNLKSYIDDYIELNESLITHLHDSLKINKPVEVKESIGCEHPKSYLEESNLYTAYSVISSDGTVVFNGALSLSGEPEDYYYITVNNNVVLDYDEINTVIPLLIAEGSYSFENEKSILEVLNKAKSAGYKLSL